MEELHTTQIVVIDRQEYWRSFATKTLRAAGFAVQSYQDYADAFQQNKESVSLFILGCVHLGNAEQQFISQLLAQKHYLLVLCSYLTNQEMRLLFLKGVVDTLDKTYSSIRFTSIVEQTLTSIAQRNSHHIMGNEGFYAQEISSSYRG
jgi:FixJ family two-component response regulator